AALNPGVVISATEGAHCVRPSHLRHVLARVAAPIAFCRVAATVGRRAEATSVRAVAVPGARAYPTTVVTQFSVADEGELDVVRVQAEGDKAVHLSMQIGAIGESARLRSFTLSSGAALSRHTMPLRYAGKDARVLISGATLLRGKQHSD